VTIHTPLTDETRDMIDAKALRAMKSEAFIINTARGGIINETALYEALSQRWILGAGLDVFVEEPARPGQTPLLTLGNLLVTPHVAGATREASRKMATHAAEEILRVLSGRRPQSLINPEIYA
jgi:phosphoglycerate dehydrogenase-like enzyme